MSWHRVSEQLPPYNKLVLFMTKTNLPRVGKLERQADGGHKFLCIGTKVEVTHWMYIPKINEDNR